MIDVSVRCLLLERRTSLGLTQLDVELLTGISAKSISVYENNRRTMNIVTAVKLATALSCSLDDLFDYRAN